MLKNEDKKRYNLGYDELENDIEVEICGLVFKVDCEKIENIKDKDEIDNIEDTIENILGEGAIERINKKRIKDGYSELNASGLAKIYGFILKVYTEVITNNMMSGVIDAKNTIVNNMADEINNTNKETYANRAQRRAYQRNYNNRNKYYRNRGY